MIVSILFWLLGGNNQDQIMVAKSLLAQAWLFLLILDFVPRVSAKGCQLVKNPQRQHQSRPTESQQYQYQSSQVSKAYRD